MPTEQTIVLLILVGAILLFVIDRFRADVVALLVLVSLVLTGLLTPEEAFSGLASPAVITVFGVFIISGAFTRSGFTDSLARQLARFSDKGHRRLVFIVMLTVGAVSGFMNNIGAVAIFMPAVITVCRRRGFSPSKLLMPMAFAALLGGNLTLIGTPPNLLAVDILRKYDNIETFAFFDFFPTGLLVLLIGIIYMYFIGQRLIPERKIAGEEIVENVPAVSSLVKARLLENSNLLGQSLVASELGEALGTSVVHIYRSGQLLEPVQAYRFQEGDVLLLYGKTSDLADAMEAHALEILTVEEGRVIDRVLEKDGKRIELILSPQSRSEGQTLRQLNFRSQFGLSVLGIRRQQELISSRLADVPLQFGDSIFAEGTQEKVDRIEENPNFYVVNELVMQKKGRRDTIIALVVFTLALVVITFNWLDVSTTLLIAALMMVILRIIPMEEAYKSVDWQSIFLIAGMLPLGVAMENTGTAEMLAHWTVEQIGTSGALGVMGGLFIMTSLVTAVISNAAATVLMVPIAIDTALNLGADPRAFVMATVIAASNAFVLPVGHQVNIIILGPGGYKFTDYARVGIGLNILLLLVVLLFLPLIWPLY